jgi:hypothetical protein
MRLADQWDELEASLPDGWRSARLSLTVAEDADADRVALILASLTPGRTGTSFRFEVTPARNPKAIVRRLDEEGIRGRIDLIGTGAAAPPEAPVIETRHRHASLKRQWDGLVADLPPDWSELYAEVELASSDFLARAALLLAPVNPARYGGPAVLRFRSARKAGYGVAPEMARRCFERLDSESITGSVRVIRVLSHTSHVSTQGPVWRVGGRSV